jgi:hypothetical protein
MEVYNRHYLVSQYKTQPLAMLDAVDRPGASGGRCVFLAAGFAGPALAGPVAAGASIVSEITQNGALDVGEGVAMSFCRTTRRRPR